LPIRRIDLAQPATTRGVSADASTLLPRVQRVASLLKRWLLGTHQGAVRPECLDYYLDEFTFRFNRRTSASRSKLFYRLFQQAVQIDPVPFDALRPNHKPQEPVESSKYTFCRLVGAGCACMRVWRGCPALTRRRRAWACTAAAEACLPATAVAGKHDTLGTVYAGHAPSPWQPP